MWQCFLIVETDREARWLRRYARSDEPCPLMPGEHSYHNSMVRIEDGLVTYESIKTHSTRKFRWEPDVEKWRGDPRWPPHCRCGYEYLEEDKWQVFNKPYYRSFDGRRWVMDDLPIGAILNAYWMVDLPNYRGPDGLSLQIKIPPGGPHEWWNIDGPSHGPDGDGPGWTRQGTPPLISVTPSILTPKYHGWLGVNTAPPGFLSDPL